MKLATLLTNRHIGLFCVVKASANVNDTFLFSFEGTMMPFGGSFNNQTPHCICSQAGESEPELAIEPMYA